MGAKLRVVFDTNAFTPQNFALLDRSPMRDLCRSGRIVPIYGHVFLEETLRAYRVDGKRKEMVEQWLPFISHTVDRFCEDFRVIWHRELVQGHGLKTNFYMKPQHQAAILKGIKKIPLDGSWQAWLRSQQAIVEDDEARDAQRKVSKDMRDEVAQWRSGNKLRASAAELVPLQRFCSRELDHTGRAFLPTLVKCHSPSAVADRWSGAKRQYRFYTTFILNMIYIAHHAMTRPNERIDLNAQADLNLMTHLLHADALVSNETGFLRQAFNDIWRPIGREIFTSEEFAALIGRF